MATDTIEEIAEELRRLPPESLPLVRKFIGSLRVHSSGRRDVGVDAEDGMDSYLESLRDYEDRLARGEVSWQ